MSLLSEKRAVNFEEKYFKTISEKNLKQKIDEFPIFLKKIKIFI